MELAKLKRKSVWRKESFIFLYKKVLRKAG